MRICDVSIPNGMEFYPMCWCLFLGCFCFNSQRDGILPCLYGGCARGCKVSIPNGMEFYRSRPFRYLSAEWFQFPTGWNSTLGIMTELLTLFSFNSQRDGILQKPICYLNCDFWFQFPTEWNSTLKRRSGKRPFKSSFNSQRDGILPV